MAPWDELPWFDLPIETVFQNVAVNFQIALANPRRIYIAFATGLTGPIHISTQQVSANGTGFIIQRGQSPVVLRAKDDPGMCQAAWFVGDAIPLGPGVTVFEVTMKGWPTSTDEREQSSWLSRLIRSLRST